MTWCCRDGNRDAHQGTSVAARLGGASIDLRVRIMTPPGQRIPAGVQLSQKPISLLLITIVNAGTTCASFEGRAWQPRDSHLTEPGHDRDHHGLGAGRITRPGRSCSSGGWVVGVCGAADVPTVGRWPTLDPGAAWAPIPPMNSVRITTSSRQDRAQVGIVTQVPTLRGRPQAWRSPWPRSRPRTSTLRI